MSDLAELTAASVVYLPFSIEAIAAGLPPAL